MSPAFGSALERGQDRGGLGIGVMAAAHGRKILRRPLVVDAYEDCTKRPRVEDCYLDVDPQRDGKMETLEVRCCTSVHHDRRKGPG